MEYRVQELEDALRSAQARISEDGHPLLPQTVKTEQETAASLGEPSSINIKEEPSDDAALPDELERTFGTLTITSDRGLKVGNLICTLASPIKWHHGSGMAKTRQLYIFSR